ncbi:MAG: DMT family transporter [Kiloniellales bacterium]|nr:DMT family transporter [Kiloniellales bacterium]
MSLSPKLAPSAKGVPAGIVWMLVTTFFFVCVHTTGKYLVALYPVGQVVWGRYVFHLLFAAVILGPALKRAARTEHLKLQLIRSALMLGASAFYFAGVQLIPLAEANSIASTTPIFVVMLAPLLLGEQVGPRRWLGVAVGFVGALIIIRPGSGLMDFAVIFLVASALCNAGYQLTTRQLGGRDEPLTTLFYTAAVGSLASSAAVPFIWEPVDASGWMLFALIGAFACIGHFTLIKAYQATAASTVAPYGYANLLWAVAFGFVVFGDLPDVTTVLGAGLIVASGLYILHRERLAARRA